MNYSKILSSVAVITALLVALQTATTAATNKNIDIAIESVLKEQSSAWNRGDLDEFLKGYLNSPLTSFVSSEAEVHGYAALRDRYVKKYGNSRDSMGTLSFSDLEIERLGEKHALCIGKWHLERAKQSPVGGIFSLVLVRSPEGWKIMHDHTSTVQSQK
jgi:ketosteroid isomerase-like protein